MKKLNNYKICIHSKFDRYIKTTKETVEQKRSCNFFSVLPLPGLSSTKRYSKIKLFFLSDVTAELVTARLKTKTFCLSPPVTAPTPVMLTCTVQADTHTPTYNSAVITLASGSLLKDLNFQEYTVIN